MDTSERIRLRAYEIWIQAGQPEGRELEHWTQARREVLGSAEENRDENPDQMSAEQPQGDELKEATELG